MDVCVVDASVLIPVFIVQTYTRPARKLIADLERTPPLRALAPGLLYAECATALWRYVQHEGYDLATVVTHLTRIRALALEVTPTRDLVGDALPTAVAYGIGAYDACYATLAQREACPLVTDDRRLVRRLASGPIAVQWLGDLPA